jgi:hypothetical protein
MPKCVGAVIHMKQLASLPVRVIAGCQLSNLNYRPLQPYSPEAIAFLTAWSRRLLACPEIRSYPDAVAFAYWCRPANLARLHRGFSLDPPRLGRGVALHITPTNVPVNFAYSFAFGLLAGNINIVRVSESLPAQADIICSIAMDLLNQAEHARIAAMTSLISYPRNDDITETLSEIANVRLIWGGDRTIDNLRRMHVPARCVDLTFADRYSLCLLSAASVIAADSDALHALTEGFYNDVFLLDQNACSSPHLVIWLGGVSEVKLAQARFWSAVKVRVESKKQPQGIHSVEKYTHFCRTAMILKGTKAEYVRSDPIFRVIMEKVPENIESYRGRYGFFFETIDNNLEQMRSLVNSRYQTLTCFGLDPGILAKHVVDNGLAGIDRVVPVGKALDIGVIWDGYDLIGSMSRIVYSK